MQPEVNSEWKSRRTGRRYRVIEITESGVLYVETCDRFVRLMPACEWPNHFEAIDQGTGTDTPHESPP